MTTREPGASEVLTRGFTVRPRSTAFFASRPAASITLGFEVLVQGDRGDEHVAVADVDAVLAVVDALARGRRRVLPKPFSATGLLKQLGELRLRAAGSSMRSCGRFGPATQG